jgi:hypothetical protein
MQALFNVSPGLALALTVSAGARAQADAFPHSEHFLPINAREAPRGQNPSHSLFQDQEADVVREMTAFYRSLK